MKYASHARPMSVQCIKMREKSVELDLCRRGPVVQDQEGRRLVFGSMCVRACVGVSHAQST